MNFEDWEIIEVPEDPEDYEAHSIEPSLEHKFEPGMIKVYPYGQAIFDANGKDWHEYMNRHLRGDYGDLPAEDIDANEYALNTGLDRVYSTYIIGEDAIFIETWPGYYTNINDIHDR